MAQFSVLQGKIIERIELSRAHHENDDGIWFYCEDSTAYVLRHTQDCCEDVHIEDIVGDIVDLIGTPVVLAEEASHSLAVSSAPTYADSATWTFYKLRTIKGSVDIRWIGTSNGYYSEGVDFDEIPYDRSQTEHAKAVNSDGVGL